MRYRTFQACLSVLILLVFAAVAADDPPETVSLELPRGDPANGRVAFVALGCTSCHQVSGEDGSTVSANPGPTFGHYQSLQKASRLGLSIFDPSHEISGTVRDREDELSPMPDFSEAMTVRQFLDIIAYLQSQ